MCFCFFSVAKIIRFSGQKHVLPTLLQEEKHFAGAKTTQVRTSCGLANVKNHPGAELKHFAGDNSDPVRTSCGLARDNSDPVRSSCEVANVKNHPGADLLRARKC